MKIEFSLSSMGKNKVALLLLSKEDEMAAKGINIDHKTRLNKVLFKKGTKTIGVGNVQEDSSVLLKTKSSLVFDSLRDIYKDKLSFYEMPEKTAEIIKLGKVKSAVPYVSRNKDRFQIEGLTMEVSKPKIEWKNAKGEVVFTMTNSEMTCSTVRMCDRMREVFDNVKGLALGAWVKSFNLKISVKGGSGYRKLRHKLIDTFIEKSGHKIKIGGASVQVSPTGLPTKSVAWFTNEGKVNAFIQEEGSRAVILGARSKRTFNKLEKIFRNTTGTRLIGDPSTYKNRKRIFVGNYIIQKIGK